ncbi:MAG: PQQ-binding-like beta-propeller repeat protein [Acidimicrobiia bacterium]|nr:PQQ-binding-like beta-propeller repeat protein [Acidimicrobiia bacterium]
MAPITARLTRSIAGLALLVAGCSATSATSIHIGPSHLGTQYEPGLTRALVVRWTATFPGPPSYALAADGRVFVTAPREGAAGTALHALDAASGAARWTADLGASPFAAATLDGLRVVVATGDGTLLALDAATGAPRWQVALGGEVSAPPTALGGTVYVEVGDGAGAGTLQARSAATGALVWSRPVPGAGSTPAVAGDTVYVAYRCGVTHALDRSTGAPRWSTDPGCETGTASTPVVDEARGRLVVGDHETGSGRSVAVLSTTTGAVVRTFAPGGTPAVAGDRLLVPNGTELRSYDLATGAERWAFTAAAPWSTAPVVVNGTVFAATETGVIHALRAEDGTELPPGDVGAPVSATAGAGGAPVALSAAQGHLFVPTGDGRLVAYGN